MSDAPRAPTPLSRVRHERRRQQRAPDRRRRARGRIIPKARTQRPVTRRVTHGTATTRLATAPDRPTRRVLPSPDERPLAYGFVLLGAFGAGPVFVPERRLLL